MKKFLFLVTAAFLNGGRSCQTQFWKGPTQVRFNLVQQFQRRRFKCESLRRTTTDAKWWQKLTWPLARWAKKGNTRYKLHNSCKVLKIIFSQSVTYILGVFILDYHNRWELFEYIVKAVLRGHLWNKEKQVF